MWRFLKWSLGFWWGIGWSAAGIALTLVAIFVWSRYHASKDDFYQARGTIADKKHRGRAADPILTIGYLARDGQPHQTDVLVSRAEFPQFNLGESIDVYVSGADPDDAWLATAGPRTAALPWIVTGLALVFIIPGPLVFATSLLGASARARTLATGLLVQGKVASVEDSGWRINRVRWPMLRVQWTGTDGQTYEATTLPMRPGQVKYDEGDPIDVYVDPATPRRGEPDPDGIRK